MLRKIKVQGFKCFDDSEVSLKNFTLLTGVNSAGKSSFIQSILFSFQQKEKGQNPLNGKYTQLGLVRDVKNAITNAKEIRILLEKEDGSICKVYLDADGKCQTENIKYLSEIDFIYLSAERIGVEDVYPQNLTDEFRIGIHGEYSFDYLSQERMNEMPEPDFRFSGIGANLGNQVDYWLNYITGYNITSERITGTGVVKVSYRKTINGSREVNPHHVGTGVSYVANIIIAALSCKRGSLFIVENPEIHLHPRAQAKLLEFFCFLSARGLQIVMETHSDHIFNGVRKNIKKKEIPLDKVAVYYFKLDENNLSRPVRIKIDENGVLKNHEKGLFDQFDEDLDELLGL